MAYNPKFGGFLWFAENGTNKLAYLDPKLGLINEAVAVPAGDKGPTGVAVDGSGNLWVTMSGSGTVDEYNPGTGSWLSAPINLAGGVNSKPQGIIFGPDGNLWVAETGGGGRIAVINPATGGKLTEFSAPVTGGISAGPTADGGVWATEANGVVRVATTGGYATTTYPTINVSPQGVVAGKDGNLWFSGAGAPNVIGAVTLSSASQASQLAFQTPPPVHATTGKGFSVVVTVENSSGLVDTFANPINGSVTLSLTGASFAAGSTLTKPVENGRALFSGLVINTAGTGYTIKASYSGVPDAISSPFTVGLQATHFAVLTQPPVQVGAGVPIVLGVVAEDVDGDVDPSFIGPIVVALAANPSGATLLGTLTLGATAGAANFSDLSLSTPGTNYSIQAADPYGKLAPITSSAFNVTAGAASHFVLTTEPVGSIGVGGGFGLVATAEDVFGNVDTSFINPVSVAVATPAGGGPLSGTTTVNAVAGVTTFSGLSLTRSGTYTFNVSGGGLPTVTTTPLVVTAAVAVKLVAVSTPPAAVAAGAPLSFTVTAEDAYNNPVSNYLGTVHLAATDPTMTPMNHTFVAGDAGSFTYSVVLKTVGAQSITATDTVNAALTVALPITVTPGSTAKLVVAGPAGASAGVSATYSVTAADLYGNATPAYSGTVQVSADDPAFTSVVYTFVAADAGVHSFPVTLKTAGSRTLTATDYFFASLQGNVAVAVSPAATSQIFIAGPSSASTGASFTLTGTARDAFGNPTPGFADTLHFSSTDAAAGLPADQVFSGGATGSKTFRATLRSSGPQTVTVADSGNPGLTASLPVAVVSTGSTVIVSASATSSVYGGPLTFTATVTPGSGGGTPTGTVVFVIDGMAGAAVALVAGSASSPAIADLGGGAHAVSAAYSGDPSYAGSASGAVNVNVAKAPLTVTAVAPSKVYGDALPGFTASIAGLVLGQDLTTLGGSLGFTTLASSSSHVATYPVLPKGFTSSNHAITYVSGNLIVNKAPLTVTAPSLTRTYGQPNPTTWTDTITGFVNGDTKTVVFGTSTPTTSATLNSGVGAYPINPQTASLSTTDYSFIGVNGVLTVAKAHLTVTADHKTKTAGAAMPALSATITGYIPGDSPSVVSGTAALSTTATPSSKAGNYPITVGAGSLTATNDDFTALINGTLTVGGSSANDFDGVGASQVAVFRPANAQWYVLGTGGGHLFGTFGATNLSDVPVPGDYDGTGKAEMAVFRPSTAQWFVMGASGGRLLATFGQTGLKDSPVNTPLVSLEQAGLSGGVHASGFEVKPLVVLKDLAPAAAVTLPLSPLATAPLRRPTPAGPLSLPLLRPRTSASPASGSASSIWLST